MTHSIDGCKGKNESFMCTKPVNMSTKNFHVNVTSNLICTQNSGVIDICPNFYIISRVVNVFFVRDLCLLSAELLTFIAF